MIRTTVEERRFSLALGEYEERAYPLRAALPNK